MFDQRFLDELIARSDIVDVVSGYVALQRKGGNLFGLCPFHNEKTPSFSVSPDKQIYHCFGCKKGGGVINFIMEIENLTFPEAVRFLAKRANLPVPEDDGPQDGANRLRRRVLELNRDAARWYYDLLCSPEGAAVSVLSSVLAAASLLLLASAVVCSDVVSFAGCEVQAQRAKSMATTRNSAICFFIW